MFHGVLQLENDSFELSDDPGSKKIPGTAGNLRSDGGPDFRHCDGANTNQDNEDQNQGENSFYQKRLFTRFKK